VLILGIETAGTQVGVAIAGQEGVLASAHSARDRRHAESLTPMIEFVASQARIELKDVSAVAVDIGPGLFTGLRVGLASAMAIAHALGVQMIGVSSLDLLAFSSRHSSRRIVTCMDARRNEVFTADYRAVPGGVQRITEPTVASPAELRSELVALKDDVLLVGDGALRYEDEFGSIEHVELAGPDVAHPSARSLVDIAHHKAVREEFVPASDLEPMYLRLPDAEINWKTRNDG